MHRATHRPSRPPGIAAATLAALVVLLAGPAPARAHEGLHEQIAEVSKAIALAPGDADLYLRRAELHRLHSDGEAAERDLGRAEALRRGDPAITLCRAALLLDAGHARSADSALARLLEHSPGRSEAWSLRARAAAALGRPAGAVQCLDSALATSRRPNVDLYLERARLTSTLGPAGPERALRGLDQGLARLGPATGLEEEAIDLELALGRHDAALERLERLAARAPRREAMVVRRAAILESAGRALEAEAAYTDALEAIEALPTDQRRAPQTAALENRIRAALKAVSPSPDTKNPRR